MCVHGRFEVALSYTLIHSHTPLAAAAANEALESESIGAITNCDSLMATLIGIPNEREMELVRGGLRRAR